MNTFLWKSIPLRNSYVLNPHIHMLNFIKQEKFIKISKELSVKYVFDTSRYIVYVGINLNIVKYVLKTTLFGKLQL